MVEILNGQAPKYYLKILDSAIKNKKICNNEEVASWLLYSIIYILFNAY